MRFNQLLSRLTGAGTESRGHACRWRFSPVGFGRKYNRLPLDAETRNTLLSWKRNWFLFLPPARAGSGRARKKNIGRGMPERREALFKGVSPGANSRLPLSSGCFCSDVVSHHPPYKAGQLPSHCCHSSISLFSFVQHSVVFPAHTFVCLVSICYY